ncbi:MBL fold metallo-hydrolase [Thiovibrio sp. JS02]
MKVLQLRKNQSLYTCNSYLLLGEWNRLEDVNTLIDPGTDGSILEELQRLSTGCGKKAVEQVILTHDHFDHAGGAAEIRKIYNCPVLAFKGGNGIDEVLRNGRMLPAGDGVVEVIHAPFHSNDSICLYCAREATLFSGDTPLRIMQPWGSYSPAFMEFLTGLTSLEIKAIYSGHDEPLVADAARVVRQSLKQVRASMDLPPLETSRAFSRENPFI